MRQSHRSVPGTRQARGRVRLTICYHVTILRHIPPPAAALGRAATRRNWRAATVRPSEPGGPGRAKLKISELKQVGTIAFFLRKRCTNALIAVIRGIIPAIASEIVIVFFRRSSAVPTAMFLVILV